MSILSAVVLLAGCNPQDADITGQYAIFLAADTSDNLDRLTRNGVKLDKKAGSLGLTPIDCRDLSSLSEEELADTRLAGADTSMCCVDGEGTLDGDDGTCEPIVPTWHTWLNQYSYYKLDSKFSPDGAVAPWRTEAVLTAEGDLQLTAHIDMPGIGDFRFGWAIDPDFQPTECADSADGVALKNTDGDWLENWSVNEDGATLWHLNAGAYQTNPSDQAVYWSLPSQWSAGTSFARFKDEEFYSHPTDYDDPLGTPMYFPMYPESSDPGALPTALNYDNWLGKIDEYLNGTDSEPGNQDLATLGQSDIPVEWKIEDNSWREDTTPDAANGFYDWAGISQSWVVIDNPEDIKVKNDKPVTGHFQVFLEGLAAPSKVIVSGAFTINKIEDDAWGYGTTLEALKEEENNTPECGEDRLTTDEPTE